MQELEKILEEMKENPANAIKDTMWKFLMDKGQKSNIPALKEYVYDLIQMTTQKTAGQRKAKDHISWDELDMTIMSIVIEATSLVLSGDLDKKEANKDMNASTNASWIPVEERLPEDEGVYDLTIINGLEEYVSVRWQFLSGTHLSGTQHYVDGVHYWADNYRGDPINEFLSERVIAWRKKPEPYRPERSEE